LYQFKLRDELHYEIIQRSVLSWIPLSYLENKQYPSLFNPRSSPSALISNKSAQRSCDHVSKYTMPPFKFPTLNLTLHIPFLRVQNQNSWSNSRFLMFHARSSNTKEAPWWPWREGIVSPYQAIDT
jgi:hypothetical protein